MKLFFRRMSQFSLPNIYRKSTRTFQIDEFSPKPKSKTNFAVVVSEDKFKIIKTDEFSEEDFAVLTFHSLTSNQ